MLAWRPPRRLRHVAGIIGRDLQTPQGSAVFFSICIPSTQTSIDSIKWKLLYCSEPKEGTSHPEWSPLPPTLKPNNPTEVCITIHSIASLHSLQGSYFDDGEGKKGGGYSYKQGIVEALKNHRAFIPLDNEKEESNEERRGAVAVVNAEEESVVGNGNKEEDTENEETLEKNDEELEKKTLTVYLEENIPGNVCATYFINFNDLFPLGEHLAGGEGSRALGNTFFLSNTANNGLINSTTAATATAANTIFLPNTLIFDFSDGHYGAYPWPDNTNHHEEQEHQYKNKTKAVSSIAFSSSATPSIAPSKEPSPFPSPRKLTAAGEIEGQQQQDVDLTDLKALHPEGFNFEGNNNHKEESLVTDLTSSAATATADATATAATASASVGLGSMLMSKLRGEATPKSGTATPTGTNGTSGGTFINSTNFGVLLGSNNTNAKVLPVDQFQDQIESLVTLQNRIQYLSTRCKESQGRIETILEQQAPARRQHIELLNYEERKQELTRKHVLISHRVEEALKRASTAEKSATVTAQALISTLQALQSAHRRISAGESSLNGEEGRGRLAMALKELIARRCLMTVQLGWILRLGPVAIRRPISHPGGLLDAQLENQWAGSGGGGSSKMLLSSPRGAPSLPSSTTTTASVSSSEPRSTLQEDIRLAICGLGLDSAVWRHAFDPGGGYEWDPAQDKAASVALGYAALLIEKLAEYLGIVLRYPVVYRCSVSVVMDNHPQAGNWKPEVAGQGGAGGGVAGASTSFAAANFLFGRTTATGASTSGITGSLGMPGDSSSSSYSSYSSSPAVAVTPVEYPLYCLSNKDRPRFAVGVFLLNKNAIQLLQAHGISAAGPSQLLQNLHKLIAAAQAGIPQGLGSGYWR